MWDKLVLINKELSHWKRNYPVGSKQPIYSAANMFFDMENTALLFMHVSTSFSTLFIKTSTKIYTIMLICVCGGTGSFHLVTLSGQTFAVEKLFCFCFLFTKTWTPSEFYYLRVWNLLEEINTKMSNVTVNSCPLPQWDECLWQSFSGEVKTT